MHSVRQHRCTAGRHGISRDHGRRMGKCVEIHAHFQNMWLPAMFLDVDTPHMFRVNAYTAGRSVLAWFI